MLTADNDDYSPRLKLPWNTRKEILRECNRRRVVKRKAAIKSVSEWAMEHYQFEKTLPKDTILKIIKIQTVIELNSNIFREQKVSITLTDYAI